MIDFSRVSNNNSRLVFSKLVKLWCTRTKQCVKGWEQSERKHLNTHKLLNLITLKREQITLISIY